MTGVRVMTVPHLTTYVLGWHQPDPADQAQGRQNLFTPRLRLACDDVPSNTGSALKRLSWSVTATAGWLKDFE